MAETLVSPGVLQRENDRSFVAPAPVEVGAAIIGPTVKGLVEIPTVVTSFGDFREKFGTTFTSGSDQYEFLTSISAQKYFAEGGQSLLVTRVVSGTFDPATSTRIPKSGSDSSNDANRVFELKTLSEGEFLNNSSGPAYPGTDEYADGSLKSGSVDNVRWEITNRNNNQGTFTLLIRRGDDSTKSKTILETFTNLSLDPKADNYISKVIGDQYYTVDTTTDPNQPLVRLEGDNPNRSRYIYVSEVFLQTPDYFNLDGSVNTDGSTSYSASLPSEASGGFEGATGDILGTEAGKYFENITSAGSGNAQGLIGTNYTQAINILKNTDDFRFNLITAPGINYKDHTTAFNSLVELAEGRGDTFFIGDLVGHNETLAAVTAETNNLNTSFAASYWPWVKVRSTELGKDVWSPASTVMPGVYAYNDRVAAPWFAPAGLNRGGLNVSRAEVKLTSAMRDTLYDARVNPIATFPRNGVVAFGQKTLQKKASALDRVNVRRLLISLKNFIGDTSKNLVFEQNTARTRNRFLNAVNPYLESVQQKQGLYAFRVIMDESNNSPDVIDRNQLVGQVLLQPTKTAEFVILDFTILPTGATFGG